MIRSLLHFLLGPRKKTSEEKGRMMNSLKIARFEIFKRVHQNLPEQLRNSDEIARAIAEQVNYATSSSQFEGDDEEMRRKRKAHVLSVGTGSSSDGWPSSKMKNVSQRPRVAALVSERGAADRLSMSFVNVAISSMDASSFINSSKSRAACRARPSRVEL